MEAEAGKKLEELTEDLEYFPYYREVYETVLGGMVGEYEIEEPDAQGRKVTQKRYGLKAFHPLQRDFPIRIMMILVRHAATVTGGNIWDTI